MSVDNMTLLAFAADHRAAVRRRLLQQSIDYSAHRATADMDRKAAAMGETDGWTPRRYIDLYASSVNNSTLIPNTGSCAWP